MGGVLAVSRAFGDRLLKKYVVADPEIQVGPSSSLETQSRSENLVLSVYFADSFLFLWSSQEESITKEVEFLVLASDGLWDVVSNQVLFMAFSLI